MREIKFRGKDIETNQWVFGNLTQFNSHYPNISWYDNTQPVEKEHYCVVYPDTVSQYTGLKDKNGIYIYEGDIVRVLFLDPIFGDIMNDVFVNAVISFNDGSFVVDYGNGYKNVYLDLLNDECEVIGNIHDNKDLLEDKQ